MIIASSDADALAAYAAYQSSAEIYDEFTANHDYELWLGNLLPALEGLGLRGDRLLDVGCGTGKSFLPMLERGWRVTACDISPAMLELARAKVGEEAKLSVADMRQLPVFGSFDLVWALDDAVNYLMSNSELKRALGAMAQNLAADGLLVFDLNTLATYREFFAETFVVEAGSRRLIWRGTASPSAAPTSICSARLEVEGDEGAAGVHRQRHFPEAEVLSCLGAVGLSCLGVFGHGEDAILGQPLDEVVHTKAIYVATRA